jgi:hypothetical protein
MLTIEETIIELIRHRQAQGLAKYGTSMERTDLAITDWLQHAIEASEPLLG